MTARRCFLWLLAGFMGVVGASCGESTSESDTVLAAALATDRFASDPADRYAFELDLRVREAEFLERCMKESGFDYDGGPVGLLVEPQPSIPGVVPAPTLDDGYGLTTRVLSIPDEAFVDYTTRVEANFRQQSGPEAIQYSLALYGRTTPGPSTPDSCEGRARDAVRASQSDLDELVREKNAEIWLQIEGDTRIAELDRDWSRCMALEGFEFGTPRQAPDWIDHKLEDLKSHGFNPQDEASMAHRRETLDEIGEEERLIAVADLSCRSETSDERIEIERGYFAQVTEGFATLYSPVTE